MESTTKVIAILEDDPDRTAAMKEALQREVPNWDTIFFDNAPEMIAWLRTNLAMTCALSLDHNLGPNRNRGGEIFDPGIGRDVVALLETLTPACPVIVHSSNGPAGDGMLYALQREGWEAERVYPINDLAWVSGEWIGRVRSCVIGEPPSATGPSLGGLTVG